MTNNGLSLILRDSEIFKEVSEFFLIYFFIISRFDAEEDKLISGYSIYQVHNNFPDFEKEVINEALRELTSKGWIIYLPDEQMQIGITDGNNILFADFKVAGEGDYKELLGDLRKKFSEYSKSLRRTRGGISKATACREIYIATINKLKGYKTLKKEDIISFYIACYELVFQEPHRPLTRKETGQFGHLKKFYSSSSVIRMIHYFMCNFEEISAGAIPNIGLLLYYKDTIYMKVRGKTKTETGERHEDF